MSITTHLHIAGKDVMPAETFDVINPYSGDVIGKAAEASYADIEPALDAAHKAQPAWEKLPQSAKRAIFLKAADLVTTEKYASKIKEYMKKETEASDVWCMINIMASVNLLRQAASQASEMKGQYVCQTVGQYSAWNTHACIVSTDQERKGKHVFSHSKSSGSA